MNWLIIIESIDLALSVYNTMKHNQKVFELHPHLSKLIDSLCFQLAVNIPDENSLSLLEIISMKKNNEINNEELIQLYRGWLQSKNIFDLFSAKQVKIYSKSELIGNEQISQHLHINQINSCLEILHDLYDALLLVKRRDAGIHKRIKEAQDLFSYLDCDGNIHLRLSQLYFLHLAMQVNDQVPIPKNYQSFKPIFKLKNKQFCEISGMVSLRWFKNYFLFNYQHSISQLLTILKDIQKNIKGSQNRSRKKFENNLPNILDEAFIRWRSTSRFSGLFQSKKKKLQIYHRIFDQNQQIFYFNGGKDDPALTQGYFIKKYGEEYIKALEIDTLLLKEFQNIVKDILNQYLQIIGKKQVSTATNQRHNKSTVTSAIQRTPKIHDSFHQNSVNSSAIYSNKLNQSYNIKNSTKSKQKTPVKVNKGNQTKRISITPTNKTISPFMQRHFGSTQRSNRQLTPNKNENNQLYGIINNQNNNRYSKKIGLQKDSFYQKLFFFRNKRVQSFDTVIKRLKGK